MPTLPLGRFACAFFINLFDIVAYEMGVLSHLVALANCPTNVAADDPRENQWGPRFQSYSESRLGRFRVETDDRLDA